MSGVTRSRINRHHALIAPDSHVTAPLPGWSNTSGVVLISPALGARFCQYLALLTAQSSSAQPAAGVQRFVFVLAGTARLTLPNQRHELATGDYAYVPPDTRQQWTTASGAKLLIFEKRYEPLPGIAPPPPHIGHRNQAKAQPFMGNPDTMLAPLLPDQPAFDWALNLFTFIPGATLPFVEVHVMEHGLWMLEGSGVYRLEESWYPVTAGDVIWMGPYCPQWFCATGRTPATYLYYKNINRDAMQP